jgi:hypothetical protein
VAACRVTVKKTSLMICGAPSTPNVVGVDVVVEQAVAAIAIATSKAQHRRFIP